MLQGVYSVLPLLILIVLGAAISKQKWFGESGMEFLSKYTIQLGIPLQMFYNITKTYQNRGDLINLVKNFPYPFLIMLVNFGIGWIVATLLKIKSPKKAIFLNISALSNTVIMGVPIISSIFGEEVLPVVMVYYAANTLLYWTFGVWLLRRDGESSTPSSPLAQVKRIFTSRPLLGFIAGVIWVIIGLPVPEIGTKILSMISNTVTPLAMFFIGSVIRHSNYKKFFNMRELWQTIGYYLIISPVVAGVICYFLPVDNITRQVFFILANMPAMTQLSIVAREAKCDYEFASVATALTSACSMFSIPILVTIMKYVFV